MVSLACSLPVGVVDHVSGHATPSTAQSETPEQAAKDDALILDQRLELMLVAVESMAGNAIVNGLIDTQDRNDYLRPFLRLHAPTKARACL